MLASDLMRGAHQESWQPMRFLRRHSAPVQTITAPAHEASTPVAQGSSPGGFPIPVKEGYVHANNLNMWYVEAGQGTPLILLHPATASNGPLWADTEMGMSWGGYLAQFAQQHRVIAYDVRGHGRTLDPSHTFDFAVYAQDLVALIDALHLEKPILCGFSLGGIVASIVGFTSPDLPRVIVNYAGVSPFNSDPKSQGRVFARAFVGGDPQATAADVSWMENPSVVGLRRIDDFESVAGAGYMRTYWEHIFTLLTEPIPYTFADFARITAPTLILTGDRDEFTTVEEATSAFRALPHGELGILPGTEHGLTPRVIATILEYLQRQ
jgi:pimeloyl-ACP methyl ester carboxylesterase